MNVHSDEMKQPTLFLIAGLYCGLSLALNLFWDSAFRSLHAEPDFLVLLFFEAALLVFGIVAFTKILRARKRGITISKITVGVLSTATGLTLLYSVLWLFIFAIYGIGPFLGWSD